MMKPHTPERLQQLNLAPKQFDIYCDEACTEDSDQFIVYGGLVLPTQGLAKFNALMKEWRTKHNVASTSELKWTSVGKN